MVFSKKVKTFLKTFNKLDNTFKKLLDVVPREFSRKETREYLKEFTLQELQEFGGVQTDLFTRKNSLPTNVLQVSYGTKNRAAKSILNIGYPNIGYPPFVWKKISQICRKQMFNKLDFVLDEKFVRGTSPDGIAYWQKEFTIVLKKLKTTRKVFKGAVYITIESFNTRVFPTEVVFEELAKK